jgi:hypothetical protein
VGMPPNGTMGPPATTMSDVERRFDVYSDALRPSGAITLTSPDDAGLARHRDARTTPGKKPVAARGCCGACTRICTKLLGGEEGASHADADGDSGADSDGDDVDGTSSSRGTRSTCSSLERVDAGLDVDTVSSSTADDCLDCCFFFVKMLLVGTSFFTTTCMNQTTTTWPRVSVALLFAE